MAKKAKVNKIKESAGERIFGYAINVFYVLVAFLCVYPFYYIFVNVLSDPKMAQKGGIFWYPVGLSFKAIKDILKVGGLTQGLLVSIGRTVVGAAISVFVSVYCGYIFSRKEMWGRKFCYRFMVVTMYFGAGLIPSYLNIKSLGLLDNPLVYVIGSFCGAYNMILTKTYIESNIPDSLEEAAIMDGGGYFLRLRKIIFPLSKPIIAVIAVFSGVGQWNSYIDYILYMRSTTWRPLQTILYTYMTRVQVLINLMKSGNANMAGEALVESSTSVVTARYAITVFSVVPVLIVYPLCQKYFSKGLMVGAIKG